MTPRSTSTLVKTGQCPQATCSWNGPVTMSEGSGELSFLLLPPEVLAGFAYGSSVEGTAQDFVEPPSNCLK